MVGTGRRSCFPTWPAMPLAVACPEVCGKVVEELQQPMDYCHGNAYITSAVRAQSHNRCA
jgi:hypothetical protein